MSVRNTVLAVFVMYAAAFLCGGYASAGEYDDRLAKALKAQERAAAKIEKIQSCVAEPAKCAAEEQAKADKSLARAIAKAEKAKALNAQYTAN